MKKTLTRKQLYDLVWSTPLISLAKQYNISDNGLRKMCVRMNIPLPKNGHWQKVKHGKRSKMVLLPDDYSGAETVELELMTEGTVRASAVTDEVKLLQLQIETELGEKLIVPQKLTNPDKLTHATRERFLARKRSDWQTCAKYADTLSISTTDALLARALRIFDTIIKALRFRKHEQELEQRQELELENFKLLLKKTKRWQRLKLIRSYIDEMEAKSIERNFFTEEIKEWIEWARKKADWYDPHFNGDDELLIDVDKETLTFIRSKNNW